MAERDDKHDLIPASELWVGHELYVVASGKGEHLPIVYRKVSEGNEDWFGTDVAESKILVTYRWGDEIINSIFDPDLMVTIKKVPEGWENDAYVCDACEAEAADDEGWHFGVPHPSDGLGDSLCPHCAARQAQEEAEMEERLGS